MPGFGIAHGELTAGVEGAAMTQTRWWREYLEVTTSCRVANAAQLLLCCWRAKLPPTACAGSGSGGCTPMEQWRVARSTAGVIIPRWIRSPSAHHSQERKAHQSGSHAAISSGSVQTSLWSYSIVMVLSLYQQLELHVRTACIG
jgi:hypothetical protein